MENIENLKILPKVEKCLPGKTMFANYSLTIAVTIVT